MNKSEVAAVLAYFGAAFPNMDISHDTADVWAFELSDIDPDVAPDAMRAVVKESEFPPTIAKFREACRVIAYRRRFEQRPPELPAAQSDDALPQELIADLRARLKDWSTKGHNHKGPEPCPVCSQRRASA